MMKIFIFSTFLFVGVFANCPACRDVKSDIISMLKGKYYLYGENLTHSEEAACGSRCVYTGPYDRLYCFQEDMDSQFDVTDAQCETVNSSPSGDWGGVDKCPSGSFASGFQLNVLPLCSKRCKNDDEVALLGIRLSCSTLGSTSIIATINSSISESDRTCAACGDSVFWTSVLSCPSGQFLSGARYKFQPPDYMSLGASDYDPSGGQNLEMSCSDGSELSGEGTDAQGAQWLGWSHCPQGQLICGIRSRVDQGHTDKKNNKGQTDVQFSCCNK